MFEFTGLAVLMGIGATALLDVWAKLLKMLFGLPSGNWAMVGRWFAYFPRLKFVHTQGIMHSAPVAGELAIGWTMHYVVGIIFAAGLLAIWGLDWAHHPSFLPALIVGLVTVGFGWFVLQPGMGVGVACSGAPNPTLARLLSITGHVVFAVGLYGTALLLS